MMTATDVTTILENCCLCVKTYTAINRAVLQGKILNLKRCCLGDGRT